MKVSRKYHIRRKGAGRGKVRHNPKSKSKPIPPLDPQYYDEDRKFCSCCGRRNTLIWRNLQKQKPIPQPGTIGRSKKVWKGHTVYKGSNYFYDTNIVNYCEKCGQKLDWDEMNTTCESRGEFWGAPCSENILTGYHCNNCGNSVQF